MSEPNEPWAMIPMPGLLADPEPAYLASRDPQRSGEDTGPVDEPRKGDEDYEVRVYAQQLWTALDGMARYLLEQVARGGSGPVLAGHRSLLSSDEQWQQWRLIYAGVLSVLAGPHGDQGYGEQAARLEYQNGYRYGRSE